MATVNPTTRKQKGVQTISYVTLTGTDDLFAYNPNTDMTLVLKNDSGGALTPSLVGNAGSSVSLPGWQPNLDASSGYSLGSIANGADVFIHLASIREVLGTTGNVTINGGTGLEALLLVG